MIILMESHAFQEPFVYSDADIVFRSSDGMNFKVHKIVLSLASVFFQDMFRLPQSTPSTSIPAGSSIDPSLGCASTDCSDSVDGLPIVQCTETGTILDNLFRLTYPIRDPTFSGIEDIRPTLEAAMKFDMPQAIYILRRELSSCIPTAPLRVYAIACLLELREEAQNAAAEVLKQHAGDTYVEEMEEITAGAYQRLLNYSRPTFFVRHLIFNPFTPLARTVFTVTTSTEANTPAQHAPHPFCADDADVTLLSSDNVEFAVSSAFVRLSSSTLDSMLTKVKTPSSECSVGHRPILFLPEPASILSIVLGFCYPGDDPALSSYDDACSALAAAVKYRIQRAIRFLVAAIPALCNDPVKLYFIACMYDLRDLAMGAAQQAAGQELKNLKYLEMDSGRISAGHLYRLLDYRRRLLAAKRSLTSSRMWIQGDWRQLVSYGCHTSVPYSSEGTYACWFHSYMQRVTLLPWPTAEAVTETTVIEHALYDAKPSGFTLSRPCASCTDIGGAVALMRFSRHLADNISKLEAETNLDWKNRRAISL
ncbi:hypothetical protein C8Q74DRAFT_1445716 [Fomes fomentarius]|nr:hypothetical protein C8Q74DRAFT_1445716 [Fomes fomentarius]